MASAAPRERRRYSPEKRRELILDHTAEIIAREGLATLTMEQIGRTAGISKSLVYAYFPNLTELLRELFKREMKHLRRLQAEAAANADTFEQIVRSVTHVYLKYYHERGLIVERLQSEPSVSEIHDATEFSRDLAVDYMTDIVIAHFDLPRDIARAATDISFGLPASAGSYLLRHSVDLKTLEDITVTMILGSIQNLNTEYAAQKRPPKPH